MAYNYDKLYGETPDALGDPAREIVEFFQHFQKRRARILDVGCGQGRDALFIARRGHEVVGVDTSRHGIRDLVTVSEKEKLAITGHVANITTFKPDGLFDVVLIDRTLHMLAEKPRLSVLKMLLDHVDLNGWVLIADEVSNIGGFEEVIRSHPSAWTCGFSKRGYLFVYRC